MKEITTTIEKFYTKKIVSAKVKIAGVETSLKQTVYEPKEGNDIDVIVIDTISTSLEKQRAAYLAANKKSNVTQQQWGIIKADMSDLLELLHRIPVHVIVNCHARGVSVDDEDEQVYKYYPNIVGSSKETIGGWFDMVFYSVTEYDRKRRKNAYLWKTQRTQKYAYAKDRSAKLPAIIPQDYQIVFDALKDANWPYLKLMVIGDIGTGKTKSLLTLPELKKE